MLLRDLIASAWASLWAHRLRAFLSILGIVIGIGSFSIMYSVGEGAKQESLRMLKSLGADLISVSIQSLDLSGLFGSGPGLPAASGPGALPGAFDAQAVADQVTLDMIEVIPQESPAVAAVTARITDQVEFFQKGHTDVLSAAGIPMSYLELFRLQPSSGRLFSEYDMATRRHVCVLGSQVASRLFQPGEDPLGKRIAIHGYLFQVIGTIDPPAMMMFGIGNISSEILIPFSVAARLFPSEKLKDIYLLAQDTDGAILEVKRFFQARFGSDAMIRFQSQQGLLEARKKNVKIFQYVLWVIGSVSLLVGGIGIMNIMLVSVTERLREIGVRRALGATRPVILMQFLTESTLLCFIGAFGGTLFGFYGARLISRFTRFDSVFSMELFAISLIIAASIGILFGTYPALRAARLDPAQVLRYD